MQSWRVLDEAREMGRRECKVDRIIVGIALFILVTGVWACLWVPPLP